MLFIFQSCSFSGRKSHNYNSRHYIVSQESQIYNADGAVKVIAVDLGIKFNQIRCLIEAGCHVKVVPWDYSFVDELTNKSVWYCI